MVYKAFAQGCKNHLAGVALFWKQCFMAKAVAAHRFSFITAILGVLNIFDCACNIHHDHHVHIGIIVLHTNGAHCNSSMLSRLHVSVSGLQADSSLICCSYYTASVCCAACKLTDVTEKKCDTVQQLTVKTALRAVRLPRTR